jgi:hypothetical protein
MWTRKFWKATGERMIRGAAAAVGAVWLAGDIVFEAFNFHTWEQVGSLAVGGAFMSLIMALIGNVASGNGPAFTTDEAVKPGP